MIGPRQNLPWYTISAGAHGRRYLFVYQTDPNSSAHIFSLSAGKLQRHVKLAAGRQTSRVRTLLTKIRNEHPDLVSLLDDQFFQALLVAVKEKSVNEPLVRRELMRIRNEHHNTH